MDLGTTIRYSEAFKLQIISELENGKWANCEQARRAYCINGTYTIQRWLKKYARNDLIRRQVRVESPNEKSELEALKKRVKELEKALVDATVDKSISNAALHIFCQEHGIDDVEAYKKNLAPNSHALQ